MRTCSAKRLAAILFASTLLPAMPLLAQDAATPATSTTTPATAPASESTTAPLRRIGGSVSSPIVVRQVPPQFSDEARQKKFMGVVLVNLIVDSRGNPQNVHVLRGVGMGLDEKAVEAIRQYRFKPAMENGKPVAVQLNVEVNFQIFDGPKILHSVPLEPSDEARQAHASGVILVALTIDPQGLPQKVHVEHGVGLNMDERAVEAVRQYRFQPFLDQNGQPVAKDTTLPLRFDAR
jgi:TonB family protein